MWRMKNWQFWENIFRVTSSVLLVFQKKIDFVLKQALGQRKEL